MKLNTGTVARIVNANPLRTHLIIANTTNTTVYIKKTEEQYDDYENNGFPLEHNGMIEISGIDCYKGGFYGVTDTDDTDIRVLEL